MANSGALLVKVRQDSTRAAGLQFGTAGRSVEPILEVPAEGLGLGAAGAAGSTWLRIEDTGNDENPWDRAHRLVAASSSFGFAADGSGPIEAIEPDIEQCWETGQPPDGGVEALALGAKEICAFDPQDEKGGKAFVRGVVAWNLLDEFSGLGSARKQVGDKQRQILIAHLDTGYDPDHATLPARMRLDLQRNFVDKGHLNDARDRIPENAPPWTNRGHGTGTLSLLAGKAVPGAPEWGQFKDDIGGAPLAQVIPIRIADWVVRFTVGNMVQGFNHARASGAHVLSMSMGGVASEALVDAVNLAYEDGMVLVTAAGNNVSKLPSPKSIVFPARLKRVLAACGVMADGRAYDNLDFRTMQGNHGPAEKMATALGAYTPNVPWAQIGCGKIIDMDGAGTSSATPQIAAAAALWLAEHWAVVSRYSEPWMRVEAVRHALFMSAAKSTARMDASKTRETIGQGVLNALKALQIAPLAENRLEKLPRAKASWSWLNLLFNHGGVSLAADASDPRRKMLALELTQLAQRVGAVDEAIDDPERDPANIPPTARSRYLQAALESGKPSKPLAGVLRSMLGATQPTMILPPSHGAVVRRKTRPMQPPKRGLRIYALDPSLGKDLELHRQAVTTVYLPWDEKLQPGPVGEYLEVVDVDPASGKVYEPVDLNHPYILAQNGLAPSEGNHQFHQQMVYAVGMTTIGHFERALGRPPLWAAEGDQETPRLRIYPHALRDENAYYSPGKRALLFGYFQARSTRADSTAPGSMVFSCLSSDIIAHEMTHALLDGLHRRFEEASNPDVVAFHEAFADIVALFQHFTNKELVRFEIGRARGDLSAAGLLGGLAREFGEGANRRGPLRNYRDPKIRDLRYEDTVEPHARGSILVFAVYEAFLNVVASRTADLLRLATGGSGVLPAGHLHPDLVNRLTSETCETATYFLQMCIRALDYCPPVDITFGEYLRAIITADRDLVEIDEVGYRTAFMEAFRKRGILPNDVRTMSEETLSWRAPEDDAPAWLDRVMDKVRIQWDAKLSRSEIFTLNKDNRWAMWRALSAEMKKDPAILASLGLKPGVRRHNADGSPHASKGQGPTTFEVHNVRPARRVAPDGSYRTEIIAVITQRQWLPVNPEKPKGPCFWFRGGATLIIDPRAGQRSIRYIVLKNSTSESRLDIQRNTARGRFLSPLRALYFGASGGEPFALIHADREAHHG